MHPSAKEPQATQRLDGTVVLSWAALGYVFFVVYGSLLPFALNDLSLKEAWARFKDVQFLNLGVGSRADMVANLILYIPVGLFCMGALAGETRQRVVSALGAALTAFIVVGLAVGVEFTQEFFPPRTVSLNDIYTECIGGALGILIWILAGRRLSGLWRTFAVGGATARRALLIFYVLLYLFLSLFPYDFLLSADEWHQHLTSDKVGWVFAGKCSLGCLAKLFPEMLGVVPFGLLLNGKGRFGRPPLLAASIVGLLLGVGIETLQLSIESGVSQGASVFSRAAGVTLGAWLPRWIGRGGQTQIRPFIRVGLLLATVPYLGLLAKLNHWFTATWLTAQAAVSRLSELRFTPFYYHYYTAEAVALVSVVFQFGLYSPLGAAVWLWRQATPGKESRGSLGPALLGFLVALCIETGKLFIPGQHPDPTNVLIAACAAGISHRLLCWVFPAPGSMGAPSLPRELPEHREAPNAATTGSVQASPHTQLGAVILLLAALLSLLGYPLGWGPVIVLLSLAGVLWKWPGSWLIVVPAALPLLDLAYLTGRLYWSEFDTLLLVSLAIAYLQKRKTQAARYPGGLPLAAFGLLSLGSLVIGLFPLAPLDLNAFTHYTSRYNALRAIKGFAFAMAYWPLVKAQWQENPARAADRFTLGMVLGLATEIAYVIWERATYSGLWNFDTDYRITGSFPGMHIGGATIETYFVLAAPFTWLWAWQRRKAWAIFLASGLYALAAYGVMVTFSRGGQVAFAVSTLVSLAGYMRLLFRDRARLISGSLAVFATVIVAGLVAWPIAGGKFSQSRLTTINSDIAIRVDHWRDVIRILGRAGNPVWGAGLGRFPSDYYWYSSAPTRPGSYAFVREGNHVFLRLGGGESLYFEQVVPVEPDRDYRIALDLRSNARSAALTVPLCEKALLYSFTCAWNTLTYASDSGQWVHQEVRVNTKHFGPPGSRFQRSVKLSMFNPRTDTVIDVANVALLDESGHNLVQNGSFSRGMQRWFFSTDSHLAWHAKNLFIHVLFEQGWLGLGAFILLMIAVLRTLLTRAGSDALALTLFVALSAFLTVGLIDSLIDEPRLEFLFFWLIIIAVTSGAKRVASRREARRGAHPVMRR
ncbi:MAG: VanZ family protein [Thiobacillaceae bacterium]